MTNFREEGWDNYAFRCHSFGKIMVEPKGKSFKQKFLEASENYDKTISEYRGLANKETKTAGKMLDKLNKLSATIKDLETKKDVPNLSLTCKEYLIDIYVREVYKREKDIQLKYFQKGLAVEEDSLTLISLYTGKYIEKNEEEKNNGFLKGTMDTEFSDKTLLDAKSCWDIWTFNRCRTKPEEKVYIWQMKGYIWLWNKQTGYICHTLVNTPKQLVEIEKKRLLNGFIGTKEDYEEACKELEKLHSVEDIPIDERVHITKVDRNQEHEEMIKERVIQCRTYLNELTMGTIQIDEDDYD